MNPALDVALPRDGVVSHGTVAADKFACCAGVSTADGEP